MHRVPRPSACIFKKARPFLTCTLNHQEQGLSKRDVDVGWGECCPAKSKINEIVLVSNNFHPPEEYTLCTNLGPCAIMLEGNPGTGPLTTHRVVRMDLLQGPPWSEREVTTSFMKGKGYWGTLLLSPPFPLGPP